MNGRHGNDTARMMERLMAGPSESGRDCIHGARTWVDIYEHAAGFLHALEPDEPVCICTEDRGLIAAAVLASLAGGPICVLPHALSMRALRETREAIRFNRAIADHSIELPAGVGVVSPARGTWSPAGARGADSIFLVLFTGGSTDRPRIWTKTASAMVGEALFQSRKYGIRGDDLFAATVPPYHIYGLLFTVLIPLLAGATVMEGTRLFPGEICSAVGEGGATVLVSVPVHYRSLNGTRMPANRLRLAFSSAGPLDPEDAAAFHRETGVAVEEIYGSTETGGIACRSSAAGRNLLEPFEPVGWRIRDDLLCVRSPFLSPELPLDADGFFVTGDRAVAAGDERFSLLGRADSVVKVGGKRVDLQDVRDRMKRLEGVRDAYVFSLPGKTGRGTAIAAIVETDCDEARLRELCAGTLEPYEMPRRIRVVGTMPSTSAGKYDRDAIQRYFNGNGET